MPTNVIDPNLPIDSQARKGIPIATGFLAYFPRAVAAIARLSWLANNKHNPGEPVHWSRDKSNDHADCAMRHFMQRETMDTVEGEEVLHIVQAAWRMLALAELELEARAAQSPFPRPGAIIKCKPGETTQQAYNRYTRDVQAQEKDCAYSLRERSKLT